MTQDPINEQVYRDLKWALTIGDYSPGDSISIRKRAAELNVSPMPVREALKRLASERALLTAAKRSFRVPMLEPVQISNLLFVRSSLEGTATELATPRMTSVQIERIAELASQMSTDIGKGDVKSYLIRNYSFHFSIYTAANNPELVSVIEGLWVQTGPFVAAGARSSIISLDWQDTHNLIVDAVRARDFSLARRHIEADIDWGVSLYRKIATNSDDT